MRDRMVRKKREKNTENIEKKIDRRNRVENVRRFQCPKKII